MEQMRRDMHGVFKSVDILVMPTTPIPPIPLAEPPGEDDVRIRNAAPFNLYGFPAISVPCGFTRNELPVGLQIVAPPWGEESLLLVANTYEQSTDWHICRPPL
jgi:aspartyl-tRNA(Asn)/glutamyl-tRNA(Gln) amidotransferase subunit A